MQDFYPNQWQNPVNKRSDKLGESTKTRSISLSRSDSHMRLNQVDSKKNLILIAV